jgi:aspartyl/asparaginyl beta-hydroxylase (cupin superfamily)
MMDKGAKAQDVSTLWRDGARALREDRVADAADAFQAMADAGVDDGAVWLGLALANRRLGRTDRMLEALDAALRLDARNLRALIMKGDHFAALGDGRAAVSFYGAAIALSAGQPLAPDLRAEIERAGRERARFAALFAEHLKAEMTARGATAPEARRVAQSLDLALGRKQVYLQQPSLYYFPELPQIQWFDRDAFPWLDRLEAATADIKAELMAILEGGDAAFSPYIEPDRNRPVVDDAGWTTAREWTACFLWKNGEPVAETLARCPKTAEALADAPLCAIPGRTPSVMFSALKAGARIPPHTGFLNTRLIGHLGLITPEGCGLRVGNETRYWREGQAWLFDDTIEHEAWNDSDQLRVILLFDVWRPELTALERELVSGVLEAIDNFQGGRTEITA